MQCYNANKFFPSRCDELMNKREKEARLATEPGRGGGERIGGLPCLWDQLTALHED